MNKPTGQAWRNWKRNRTRERERLGLAPNPGDWSSEWERCQENKESLVAEGIRHLQEEVIRLKKEALSSSVIRHEILKLSKTRPPIPGWLIERKPSAKSPGVPTLLLSDWHFGEVVDPDQIGGCNSYSLEIARKRAKRCIQSTIDLLTSHMVNPDYPGIVLALAGDMISGDIHDELRETNELASLPTVVDLFGVLTWAIETLADQFGNVFIPCVTGNHGRTTNKPRHKNRHHTNYDWLLYSLLEKRFESDDRIRFLVSDGADACYKIFRIRYLLTHGDQFRGGDGMIGALGPIIRGDHRKRGRNTQIGQSYDTMILGHWHQLIQMQRLIVNGSLVGYSEYAWDGNFPYEPPRQALWITHPEYGITFQMPVLVEEPVPDHPAKDWIAWRD